ncbi:MAG: flavodoxin-dependent (E)-4-hydroxy-3-methylbut-2-enyl-diphosphate synthase [Candidatus Caldatribacterium sp.]|uniref:flavodoxin-dependent (E)-4-hydroxy-3-methylbut-2-enyl-diphosphate synthase n=1 Tax=Candidatus Caldatribacterium sp. TaxID=2282143 RepID=UPI0029984CF9|nr:flavodoxin-dependent (E)-4-hydroxy-3-methylbut-2-enyl-diphosphate synthase [Candidatus Caldatribacterium sp.]MCX7731299.1 flavodoxin-dependent (E)-4-hydroxy-3-methylbut-2-enyl-diphosphate synthase [Candidatus Caldatribacterium sp.]MDW8080744.1 flavodoxin-dependent (E)-4-hydroxy-3-methylbut-2-enyl-diphosphate synthase [Candidatus Calescibacterium sp.]
MIRRRTREVPLGPLTVGGEHPIWVEAMGRKHPGDWRACLEEVDQAFSRGCEIFRIAVFDEEGIEGLREIRRRRRDFPLVADIHFNAQFAFRAVEVGVDAVRVNPGTFPNRRMLESLIEVARDRGVTLRIGANVGSLPFALRGKEKSEALFESVAECVNLAEQKGMEYLILSAKSSDIGETVAVYRKLSEHFPYPLHIGLTEAGSGVAGIVKSSVALGILLAEGIGDTIRVSLTSRSPILEIEVGWEILKALGVRSRGIRLVSCPTCARARGDVVSFVREFQRAIATLKGVLELTVAIMGCEVNGPGEAREADFGLALSVGGRAVLFARGEVIAVVPQEGAIARLVSLVQEACARGEESTT